MIRILMLTVTSVKDPNNPLSFDGAASNICSGTATVDSSALAPARSANEGHPIDMINYASECWKS